MPIDTAAKRRSALQFTVSPMVPGGPPFPIPDGSLADSAAKRQMLGLYLIESVVVADVNATSTLTVAGAASSTRSVADAATSTLAAAAHASSTSGASDG